MTSRDTTLIKAGNELSDRLEEAGEKVIFLDGQSPFGISFSIKEGKKYVKGMLILKDVLNKKGNPMWRAKKLINEYLSLGFDQVVLLSIHSKTGQKSILNYNIKGRMSGNIGSKITS